MSGRLRIGTPRLSLIVKTGHKLRDVELRVVMLISWRAQKYPEFGRWTLDSGQIVTSPFSPVAKRNRVNLQKPTLLETWTLIPWYDKSEMVHSICKHSRSPSRTHLNDESFQIDLSPTRRHVMMRFD